MTTNTQPPEQPARTDTAAREVFEIFYTMQGEGPFNGTPAIFLRLSGCNLQCPACDTDYTSKRVYLTPDEIFEQADALYPADNEPHPLLVITGGEPFRQDVAAIVRLFNLNGWHIQIETNGTLCPNVHEFPWHAVTIVCSPKTPKINGNLTPHIEHYKYVLADGFVDTDGLPTVTLGKHRPARPAPVAMKKGAVNAKPQVFVQPLDEQDPVKNANNTRAALESCMRFGYRLCLQTHKMLNLP